MSDELRPLFRNAFTASANAISFDSAEIKGPAQVRLVSLDLSAFLAGAARLVTLFWAKGPVASQGDLDKRVEANLVQLAYGGGGNGAFFHELDVSVREIKHIAVRVISIDATDRTIAWTVMGHG